MAALVTTMEPYLHVSLVLKLADYSLIFLQLAFCPWLLRHTKNPHIQILPHPFAKVRKLEC